ncbi:MAG: O-antigen polymerase [Bryobacterales bacterium]|jgi:O-antigen ligase|nr:O-antigen polymerase [Bryobacterales bacterium]
MRTFTAIVLALTTVATIAVMWVPAKWPTSIPEIATCALAALWALWILAGKAELRLQWVLLPLTGVVALAGLQIITGGTVYAWPTRMASFYWAANLATFVVALQLFADRQWRTRYLDGLLIFGTLLAIVSTAQSLTSPGKIFWNFPITVVETAMGPFLYANQYAAFAELILPLALFGSLTLKKGRVWCVLAAAILVGSVIHSGSRGGSALVLAELALVPVLTARRGGISRSQVLNTGAVLLVALLWVAVAAGPDTLYTKVTASSDAFAGRREFNQSSLAMIQARPLQGFGLWNWPTAYPGFALFDDGLHANQAHNDWLQWTVEGGLPLLLIMLSVAVWAVPRAIRSGWGLGVAAVLVHCLWDYPIQRPGVAIVFFTMMAAIAPYGGGERLSRSASEKAE